MAVNLSDRHNGAPLDEVEFIRPEVVQYFGGVHENSVHHVFAESPFFDHTTKNGLLWHQKANNFETFTLWQTREALETRLKQMNGVEYLVVGEPQKETDPAMGPDTGIWVIRKQDRRKRPPHPDEITVLATYYVLCDHIYQAPSVYDIVGNHLLSAIDSLSKFTQAAAPLPLYTPATGYTYFPPATAKSLPPSQTLSRGSREASIAQDPTSQLPTAALEPTTQPSTDQPKSSQDQDARHQAALYESFNMMLHYGDEYQDENPLRGEPGNFTFSATKDRVRAKAAEAEAAKAKEAEMAKKLEEARLAAKATPFASSAATKKDDEEKTKKKVKDKLKKRRSKIAGSPSTPASPATPAS